MSILYRLKLLHPLPDSRQSVGPVGLNTHCLSQQGAKSFRGTSTPTLPNKTHWGKSEVRSLTSHILELSLCVLTSLALTTLPWKGPNLTPLAMKLLQNTPKCAASPNAVCLRQRPRWIRGTGRKDGKSGASALVLGNKSRQGLQPTFRKLKGVFVQSFRKTIRP